MCVSVRVFASRIVCCACLNVLWMMKGAGGDSQHVIPINHSLWLILKSTEGVNIVCIYFKYCYRQQAPEKVRGKFVCANCQWM